MNAHCHPFRFAASFSIVALASSFALGQATEYTLSDDRAWAKSAAPEPGTDAAAIADARRLLADNRPKAARNMLSRWIDEHDSEPNEWLPEAYLLRGDAKVALDREFKALYDYERVLRGYWGSEAFPIANRRELEIAKAYSYGRKARVWGLRVGDGSDIAVEILIRVQEREPGSTIAEEAGIELADFYYRKREMSLAHDTYDLYLQNYPRGPHRLRAMQRLIQTDVARFKGPRYDSSGLLDARVRIENFLERYPTQADSSGINEALLIRVDESLGAQLLDTGRWYLRTNDEPSARIVFRRLLRDHPETLAAQRAQVIMRKRGWDDQSDSEQAGPQQEADSAEVDSEQDEDGSE